jgi:hypothetical protein
LNYFKYASLRTERCLKHDRSERITESKLLELNVFDVYKEWEKEVEKSGENENRVCSVCENAFIQGFFFFFFPFFFTLFDTNMNFLNFSFLYLIIFFSSTSIFRDERYVKCGGGHLFCLECAKVGIELLIRKYEDERKENIKSKRRIVNIRCCDIHSAINETTDITNNTEGCMEVISDEEVASILKEPLNHIYDKMCLEREMEEALKRNEIEKNEEMKKALDENKREKNEEMKIAVENKEKEKNEELRKALDKKEREKNEEMKITVERKEKEKNEEMKERLKQWEIEKNEKVKENTSLKEENTDLKKEITDLKKKISYFDSESQLLCFFDFFDFLLFF